MKRYLEIKLIILIFFCWFTYGCFQIDGSKHLKGKNEWRKSLGIPTIKKEMNCVQDRNRLKCKSENTKHFLKSIKIDRKGIKYEMDFYRFEFSFNEKYYNSLTIDTDIKNNKISKQKVAIYFTNEKLKILYLDSIRIEDAWKLIDDNN